MNWVADSDSLCAKQTAIIEDFTVHALGCTITDLS